MRNAGLVIAMLWGASTAQAHPALDAAREAVARGDFRETLVKLEQLEKAPDATTDELADMHWYRGLSYWALGKKPRAQESLQALVRFSPLYEPNRLDAPPDVRAAFDAVRDAYRKAEGVDLAAPELKAPALITAVTRNADKVNRGQVYIRARGSLTYARLDMVLVSGRLSAVVKDVAAWEAAATGGGLEVVVEALGPQGAVLARLGNAKTPSFLPVGPAEKDAALAVLAPAPVAAPEKPAPVPQAVAQAPAAAAQADSQDTTSTLRKVGRGMVAGGVVAAAGTVASVVVAGICWAAFLGAYGVLDSVPGTDKSPALPALVLLAGWGVVPAAVATAWVPVTVVVAGLVFALGFGALLAG